MEENKNTPSESPTVSSEGDQVVAVNIPPESSSGALNLTLKPDNADEKPEASDTQPVDGGASLPVDQPQDEKMHGGGGNASSQKVSVLKPIAIDTKSSETASESPISDLASPIKKPNSGPASLPLDNRPLATQRGRRQRKTPNYLEPLDIKPIEATISSPSQKTPISAKSAKKSPASSKNVLFEKDDFCTVRCDGEKFYLCKLLGNVVTSSRAMIPIRWLELDKAPNEYIWSHPDKIDKATILTNVNVENLGKDRISLPNAEIMRSMYVLKKSILSEKGENVTLELPPELSEFKSAPLNVSAPSPAKQPKNSFTASDAPSEEDSDDDFYLPAPSRNRGKKASNVSRTPSDSSSSSAVAPRPRGRPPKNPQHQNHLNGGDRRPPKDEADDEYLPSSKKRKSAGRSPSIFSPSIPTKSSRVSDALSNVKVSSNDIFCDPSFNFENSSAAFMSREVIRAALFADHEKLQALMANSKVESIFAHRSTHVRFTAIEAAALNSSINILKMLLGEESNKAAKRRSYSSLLPPEECLLRNQNGPSDLSSALPRAMFRLAARGLPSDSLEFIIPQLDPATINEMVLVSLRHGNIESANLLMKSMDVLKDFSEFVSKTDANTINADLIRKSLPIPGAPSVMHLACANTHSAILARILELHPDLLEASDKDGYSSVHYAAACASSINLEMLLKRGADPSAALSRDLITPLMLAAKLNRVTNIDVMMKQPSLKNSQKSAIQFCPQIGQSALHMACEHGSCDAVVRFLEFSPDLNTRDVSSRTPLMLAAAGGHFDVCEVLLKHGVDDVKDGCGRTAVFYAAMNGHLNVLTLLIGHRMLSPAAAADDTDHKGRNVVHYACAAGWAPCVDLLVEVGLPCTSEDNSGLTPLHMALMNHHTGIAGSLCHNKLADVNWKDAASGRTVLHRLCQSPGVSAAGGEVVQYVLEELRASAKLADCEGNTAIGLLAAAVPFSTVEEKQSSVEIAKYLVSAGCDTSLCSGALSRPPFIVALHAGNWPLCKYLAHNTRIFVDLGSENDAGENALHLVLANGCLQHSTDLLTALLPKAPPAQAFCESAVSVSAVGCTPLQLLLSSMIAQGDEKSLRYGFETLCCFLTKFSKIPLSNPAGCRSEPVLHSALRLCVNDAGIGMKMLDKMLALQPDCNEVFNGMTALHVALDIGLGCEVMEKLVSSGADINLVSEVCGSSPLMIAGGRQNVEAVSFLLGRNASTEGTNRAGEWVLHVVVKNIDRISGVQCVEKLLPKIPKPDVLDRERRTALHHAVNIPLHFVPDVCSLLIKAGCSPIHVDQRRRTALHHLFLRRRRRRADPAEAAAPEDPLDAFAVFQNTCPDCVHVVDDGGCSALHYAAAAGATLCCQIMTEMKVDCLCADKDGNVPLVHAVLHSKEDCAISMLKTIIGLVNLKSAVACVPPPPPSCAEEGSPLVRVSLFSLIVQRGTLPALMSLSIQAMKRAGDSTDSFILSEIIRSGRVDVASTFLHKMYPDSLLLTELNHNHVHDVALAQFPVSGDVPQLVALLLAKGEKLLCPDKPNLVLPHHYAAFYGQLSLLKALIHASPSDTILFARDNFDRSIFAAALMSADLPVIEFCLDKCMAPKFADSLVKFCTDKDPNHSTYDEYNFSTTEAITCLMYCVEELPTPILKLLVSSKKFGLNKCDDHGRTALMLACVSGELERVLILLDCFDVRKNSSQADEKYPTLSAALRKHSLTVSQLKNVSGVNLDAVDNEGNTLAHYCVNAHENIALFELLMLLGADVDATNKAGVTPVMLAAQKKLMVTLEYLSRFSPLPTPDVALDEKSVPTLPAVPPFNEHCLPFWEEVRERVSWTRLPFVTEVDPNCSAGARSDVVVDDVLNVPLDARMMKCDFSDAPESSSEVVFSFYKMQLVNAKSRNLFLLHTCWGQIGTETAPQSQSIPFQSLEQARKEFARLFRNKTDNSWDMKEFQARPKKFSTLRQDYYRKCKEIKPVTVDLRSGIASAAEERVQHLVQNLSSQEAVHLACFKNLNSCFAGIDIPMGSTSAQAIESLESLLRSVRQLCEEIDAEKCSANPDYTKILHNYQSIFTFSSELHYCLPVNFDPCHSRVISTWRDLELGARLIASLKSIHLAAQIVFAASIRRSEINPIDYILACINCSVSPVEKTTESWEEIQKCLCFCAPSLVVSGLYRVEKPQSASSAIAGKRDLVWLPVECMSLLGLLSEGIVAQPVAFGKKGKLRDAVLVTDLSDGAAAAAAMRQSVAIGGKRYLVLCAVSLGQVIQPSDDWDGHCLPASTNTVHVTKRVSALEYYAGRTLPDGARLRCARTSDTGAVSQLAVLDESRVSLAYLVEV